jgi:hypothetical protein
MRPFFVVDLDPVVGDSTHLMEVREYVRVEHFVAEGPVEAFHEGVLVRLPWLDEAQLDAMLGAPLLEVRE